MTWTGSARRDRLPPDWHVIRARVLDRDGHACRWVERGVRCGAPATHVDHVEAMTDDHRDEALQSLCAPHHQHKSAHEGATASARARANVRRPMRRHPGLRW